MSKETLPTKTYDIVIVKHNRVWTNINILNSNGTKFNVNTPKQNPLLSMPAGTKTTVRGYLIKDAGRYGTKWEFRVASEKPTSSSSNTSKQSTEKQSMSTQTETKKRGMGPEDFVEDVLQKLESLINAKKSLATVDNKALVERANRNYKIYDPGYGSQIWINLRKRLQKINEIYEKDVRYEKARSKLESVASYRTINPADDIAKEFFASGGTQETYNALVKRGADERKQRDEENERKLAAARKEYDRKMKEEAAQGIISYAESAEEGRPIKGETKVIKGKVYEVLSATYHDSDGYSFGAMNEEWYSVKAKDISNTAKGQRILQKHKKEERESARKRRYKAAENSLVSAIEKKGQIYRGKEVSINDIPGKTLSDTFNIYGGGRKIKSNSGKTTLIINNGMDGDNWGRNNIRTGGAGAYAYIADTKSVANELKRFEEARLDVKYGESPIMRRSAERAFERSSPRGIRIRKPKTPVAKKIEGMPKKETIPRGRRDMPSLKTKKGKLLKAVEKTRRGYCVSDTVQSYWILTDKLKKATQKKTSKKKKQ